MNDLRALMRAGQRVIGTFVKLPVPEAIDLVDEAGFDFALVDFEHAQMDEAGACRLVRHARARGLPALVRVATLDAGVINRLLEAGAAGIQLSTLRSAAAAKALRDACLYPPAGRRSLSLAHPGGAYGGTPLDAYLAAHVANPPLVVGQIETATTDSPLAEILPHLDLAFLGTTDLSVDLGVPGKLNDPKVTARIAEITGAARTAGIPHGAFFGSQAPAEKLAGDARYLVIASDVQLLGESLRGLRTGLATLRG